ncbi:hypothetical protein [Caballeronia sp. LZ019]|uniref:hypothetical protein n=1 Tax=Caballeronia sp. LZ019 TaxID=3038555 RepID=UPI002860C47E|nr:hypothetical protein [Caballeronia sp. LZ019]MDR5809293.1 hypothetical protein [Caballeronia sp. LZ019]
MNLVDITQDGAGIASKGDPAIDGFITGLVETCSVYVFHGALRYAMVHDTGQLALSGICEIAAMCGHAVEVFYAINPELLSKEAEKAHRERRTRLCNLVKPKGSVRKLEIPDGNLVSLKDGRFLLRDREILAGESAMSEIPHREVRKDINLLNNLFSRKNSQSLPVDFQFSLDHYTPIPPLLKSEAQMDAIAREKLAQGDGHYASALEIARRTGLFEYSR